MTNRIISGNRSSEDLIREYLRKTQGGNGGIIEPPIPEDTGVNSRNDNDNSLRHNTGSGTSAHTGDFYYIPNSRFSNIPAEYIKFLNDAGYGNLSTGSAGLQVAKSVLKIDAHVRTAARQAGVTLNGNDGD